VKAIVYVTAAVALAWALYGIYRVVKTIK